MAESIQALSLHGQRSFQQGKHSLPNLSVEKPIKRVINLNKEMLKFLNKETYVVIIGGYFMISREITPNGYEHMTEYIIREDGTKMEYMKFWYNPKLNENKDKPPKHTGGKKPYLMLMINEIEDLRNQGVKNVEELIGYVVCLGKYIEWNTGKLIHKRSKKPIQYKDLFEIYKVSKPKLNKMINLMKEHDLLYYTDEGYFISPKYIKKGKSKK